MTASICSWVHSLIGAMGRVQIPGGSFAGVFHMGGSAVANSYVSILEPAR